MSPPPLVPLTMTVLFTPLRPNDRPLAYTRPPLVTNRKQFWAYMNKPVLVTTPPSSTRAQLFDHWKAEPTVKRSVFKFHVALTPAALVPPTITLLLTPLRLRPTVPYWLRG